MRILFVCGSLEAGRDGVGDYTRRLACELIRQGHETAIIALNDKYVKHIIKDTSDSEGVRVQLLRLPSGMDLQQRFKIAEQWTGEVNPEWISLQYVPFAFHPKGLTQGLNMYLKALGKGRKWHILFHELWLGMHSGSSAKESLWGFVQRKMILSLLRILKPELVHTQSTLYKKKLSAAGVNVSLLPLFSNIPVFNTHNASPKEKNDKNIIFVLFGEVHNTGAPVHEFARDVKAYSIQNGLHCSLMILGRSGNEQEHWKNIWESLGMQVRIHGELPPDQISIHLQKAHYGITTTVYGKVEKSGSVAAMLEHQLGIICVAGEWKPKGMEALGRIPGVTEYKQGHLESLFMALPEENTFCKIEETARKLISSLQSKN